MIGFSLVLRSIVRYDGELPFAGLLRTSISQPLNQCGPFLVERGAVKLLPCPLVPVVGVPGFAFLAMQVGVDGHPLRSL